MQNTKPLFVVTDKTPVKYVQPTTGATDEVWEGYSWPCLGAGPLWYLSKEMYGAAIIATVLVIFTAGWAWPILPFFANGQHKKWLEKKGYKPV